METALYRKYRPKNFSEVIGQDHIINVLEGALREGSIAHAYLFSGSRGTGKTSVARILAREIGTSDNDLYEIDAASNRGIDDIRELREAVTVLPFDSRFKVYIIDEVHMMTREAFNALLKTLEEPPKHAVFMLATTEFEKLPETIVSRCQGFTFKKPSQRILKDAVNAIAKKEGFLLEAASADLIAMLGDGSFRDATGILQKVISSSADRKVSISEVEAVTGAPRGRLINDFISAIEGADIKSGLKAIHDAVENNADMKVFLKLILHKARSVMLIKYAPDMEKIISNQFGEEDFIFLKALAGKKDGKIGPMELKALLDAYDDVGRAYIPQLPLELALIKIITNNRQQTTNNKK
jgi:DNA polymerase III subunit gamma/tau